MFALLRAHWARYVSPRLTLRRRGSSPVVANTPTLSRPEKPSVTVPVTPKDKVRSGRIQKQTASAMKYKSGVHYKLSDDRVDLPVTPANRGILDGEGYESNEDTLVRDATPGDDDMTLVDTPLGAEGDDYIDVDPERTRREKALDQIAHGDWTSMEVNLFNKLNIRGFDPLLPSNWQMDFPTCPNNLFTADKSRAFIHSRNGNDFRAIKALFSLFTLGARARDRLKVGLRPEQVLVRCIRSYVKWSLEDSDLHRCDYIPALVVVAKGLGESNREIVARCQTKIHALGQRYRDHQDANIRGLLDDEDAIGLRTPGSTVSNLNPTPLSKTGKLKTTSIKKEEEEDSETEDLEKSGKRRRSTDEPITLYGIIVGHTIVCFVTYDISFPDKAPRTLTLFDFSDPEQDVWNAFAITIMVIWARNFLLSQNPPVVEDRIDISDPDL